jgi:F-type H+-transporting ATPase subunit alpha
MPLSPEFQLAWMMAYNSGRFDDPDSASVHNKLAVLAEGLQRFPIDLSASREEWNRWLDLRLTGLGNRAG